MLSHSRPQPFPFPSSFRPRHAICLAVRIDCPPPPSQPCARRLLSCLSPCPFAVPRSVSHSVSQCPRRARRLFWRSQTRALARSVSFLLCVRKETPPLAFVPFSALGGRSLLRVDAAAGCYGGPGVDRRARGRRGAHTAIECVGKRVGSGHMDGTSRFVDGPAMERQGARQGATTRGLRRLRWRQNDGRSPTGD